MIDYSICKNITADTKETGRVYNTPDGVFPSITTILGQTSNNIWLQKWKDKVGEEEAKRISKVATDRGELIHAYLEKYWNKESINNMLLTETPDVQQMTLNLVKCTTENVTKVYAQEIPVWSKTLKSAGRLDMFGEWRGVPSIIDFKTSKKKKYIKDIKDYYIQCAFYAHSHNELFNTDIKKLVILITVEGADVQVFESIVPPYIPELKFRINQFNKLKGIT